METIKLLSKGEKVNVTAEQDCAVICIPTTPALPLSSTAKTRSMGSAGGTMAEAIKNPHSKTDITLKYNVQLSVTANDAEAIEKRGLLAEAKAIG